MLKSQREYLLLHRTPENGDFWQGVTGGVEEGEEILQTAKRELLEETGFDSASLIQIDYHFSFPNVGFWKEKYNWSVEEISVYTFLATIDKSNEPIFGSNEHDQYLWCDFKKASEMLHWEKDKEALRHCELTFL